MHQEEPCVTLSDQQGVIQLLTGKRNCQALVPNPSPPSPQTPQAQSQPSPTQFQPTPIEHKGDWG